MSTITFGRVEIPDIEMHDLTGINFAWVDAGPRGQEDIVGICRHRMVGTLAGTTSYFANEARYTALTDFGIGGPWDGPNDGVIHQYIPKGSRMSPSASGPASDLEGDGIAFVRVLGVSAVNRRLKSLEYSDGGKHLLNPFGPIETRLQWANGNALIAYIFDQAEVPWDQFPKHPKYNITTFLDHFEFGPKDCPFKPMRDQTSVQIAAIRGVLKAAQTGVGTQAPGKVVPIPADPADVRVLVPYSTKEDTAFLRRRFGSAIKIRADGTAELGADGKPRRYGYDPKGVVSNAWINRSLEDQAFPSLIGVFETAQDERIVTTFEFQDGRALIDVNDDKRGWYWAGEEAA